MTEFKPQRHYEIVVSDTYWQEVCVRLDAMGLKLRPVTRTSTRYGLAVGPRPTASPADLLRRTPHRLSSREFQVLSGMRRGLSNGAIGRELELSEDTIKTHAKRLYRKLGVNDRAGAVAEAYERGWLVPAGGGRRA